MALWQNLGYNLSKPSLSPYNSINLHLWKTSWVPFFFLFYLLFMRALPIVKNIFDIHLVGDCRMTLSLFFFLIFAYYWEDNWMTIYLWCKMSLTREKETIRRFPIGWMGNALSLSLSLHSSLMYSKMKGYISNSDWYHLRAFRSITRCKLLKTWSKFDLIWFETWRSKNKWEWV